MLEPIKLVTFYKPKYGEQIVAVDNGSLTLVRLFDAVDLFASDTLEERIRVRDQARDFAERFVAQMNSAMGSADAL